MTTVQQIYEAMQAIAPLALAEQLGQSRPAGGLRRADARVLVTLDITPEVVAEAAARAA